MNRSLFEQKPAIAVLESSGKWQTVINLLCPEIQARRVLNLEHLSAQIRCTTGLIAVIELPASPDTLKERIKFVGFNAPNPNQACFVGVLDARLTNFQQELNQFGFSEVFCNLFQLVKFPQLYENHCKAVQWPDLTIEQQITSHLS